jgi:hypothetical protein
VLMIATCVLCRRCRSTASGPSSSRYPTPHPLPSAQQSRLTVSQHPPATHVAPSLCVSQHLTTPLLSFCTQTGRTAKPSSPAVAHSLPWSTKDKSCCRAHSQHHIRSALSSSSPYTTLTSSLCVATSAAFPCRLCLLAFHARLTICTPSLALDWDLCLARRDASQMR